MIIPLMIGIAAGIASTVQASINTEARKVFRSPFITAGINFTVAWLALAVFITAREHRLYVPLGTIASNPPWIWLGGVCAIIIVTLNILCVPKLGAAGNVMIINFGQIMTGLVIDHFALFRSDEARMSMARLAGAVLVIAGMMLVTVSRNKNGESARRSMSPVYAVLAFICGIACSVQIAVNGALRVVLASASKATLISMSVAFVSTLLLTSLILLLRGRDGVFDAETELNRGVRLRPWMLCGGFFAVMVVSGNALVAPVIGTGLNTIMNLIGMMGGGLIIDATGFLGIRKQPVTVRKVAGMLLMLAGTAFISLL